MVRIHLAQAAVLAGVPFLSLNCEQRWKHGMAGFGVDDARKAIREMRKVAPQLALSLTSYGQPGLHSDFPWQGFGGVDVYQPELYGQGDAASIFDWCEKFASQYSTLRQTGRMVARPIWPDMLAGNVPSVIGSWLVDAFETVTMWVLGCSRADDDGLMDDEGELLCRCLNALAATMDPWGKPYVGVGRVSRFQFDKALSVDGKIGAQTRAALGL
jgi:hypothetical protein